MTSLTASTYPPRRPLINPEITLKAAIILAALALSACGLAPATAPTPGPTTASPPSASPSPIQSTAVLLAKPPSAPKREYPALSTLAGMTPDQVIGLLGPPRFKRRDNPAEIWQYRNKACALDLFLYRVGNGAAYRVRHFETRMRGREKITGKVCFSGLLQEHENRRPG